MGSRFVELQEARAIAQAKLVEKIQTDRQNAAKVKTLGAERISTSKHWRRIIGLDSARSSGKKLADSANFSRYHEDIYYLLILANKLPDEFLGGKKVNLEPTFNIAELVILARAVKANWFSLIEVIDTLEPYK